VVQKKGQGEGLEVVVTLADRRWPWSRLTITKKGRQGLKHQKNIRISDAPRMEKRACYRDDEWGNKKWSQREKKSTYNANKSVPGAGSRRSVTTWPAVGAGLRTDPDEGGMMVRVGRGTDKKKWGEKNKTKRRRHCSKWARMDEQSREERGVGPKSS